MSIVLDGTTGLAGAATGALNGTLGATTPNTVVATSVNTPNTFGFKNRIINGAMVISQGAAGASVTPATSSTYTTNYPVDRWQVVVSAASKLTAQQNAGSLTPVATTGFTNYLGITSSSAYSIGATDYFIITQRIEGFNIADLAWGTASAKTATLSFWVYSSLTGTFGGSLQNSGQSRHYPFSYTISAANTWEQKTITIAGDTSGTWLTTNGVGIQLNLGLGVGSTYSGTAGSWSGSYALSATGATSVVGTSGATFYITGVQLEKGSTATSFDVRDYGRELMMCQRYYFRKNSSAVNDVIGNIQAYNGGSVFGKLFDLPVTMRTNPTVSLSAITHIYPYSAAGANLGNFTAVSGWQTSPTSVTQLGGFSGSSGLVAGNVTVIGWNTASGWIAADSEL